MNKIFILCFLLFLPFMVYSSNLQDNNFQNNNGIGVGSYQINEIKDIVLLATDAINSNYDKEKVKLAMEKLEFAINTNILPTNVLTQLLGSISDFIITGTSDIASLFLPSVVDVLNEFLSGLIPSKHKCKPGAPEYPECLRENR